MTTTTTTTTAPKATPKNNDYASDWRALLATQAKAVEKLAGSHRVAKAKFVLKMAKSGYSDAQIAKILGISGVDVGRLIAEAVGDSVGISALTVQQAIKDGVSIAKIKASRKAGKTAEIKAQLESIGLVAEPKESGTPARETSTIKTRTDKAIAQLRKIASDAKLGKTGLVTIASIMQELANELGDFDGLCGLDSLEDSE